MGVDVDAIARNAKSAEERGESLYREIQSTLPREALAQNRYIVIDIATGRYAIGATDLEAFSTFRTTYPNAVGWMRAIGGAR